MQARVDEITKCWSQAPIRDAATQLTIWPLEPGESRKREAIELPFTPYQGAELRQYINSISTENWRSRGGNRKFFPGTPDTALKSMHLCCDCAGERPRVESRTRLRVHSKRCGCNDALLAFVWKSAQSTVCTVKRACYQHSNHPPAAFSEVSDNLSPEESQKLVTYFASLSQNPPRKVAMDEACKRTGRYVKADAIDAILRKARKLRDLEAEQSSLQYLEKQRNLKELLVSAEDIMWRTSKQTGDSQRLFGLLKEMHLLDSEFKFIVEFGLPTLEQLLGYQRSFHSVLSSLRIHASLVLANLSA